MQHTLDRNTLISNMSNPRNSTARSMFDDAIVNADELAEMLQVSKGFVYKMAREKRIPTIRIGRAVRFNVGAVERELGIDASLKNQQ